MVLASKQQIQVIVEYIQKGAERVNRTATQFNKGLETQQQLYSTMNTRQKRLTENLEMNRIAQKGFSGTMRLGQPEFKRFNEHGRRFETLGGRMASKIRLATHGLRGFRMEMLGVMFFGMAMQRVFSGLLKTSLTWVGVNEILTTTLGVLFLPVAMMVLDWAIKFMDWVSKLTEAQKLFIGKMVLAAIALGSFLLVVGTLALGIGSLIQAFGFLSSPLLLVGAALAAIAAWALGGSLFEKLTKDTENLGLVMNGIDFTGIKDKLVDGLKIAIDFLSENLPIWFDKGLELAGSLLDGVLEKGEDITEALSKMVETMITWVGENADKIFEIGFSIAKGILKGIGKGLFNVGEIIRGRILEKLEERQGLISPDNIGAFPSPSPTSVPAGATFGFSSANQSFPAENKISIVNDFNVTVSDRSEFEDLLRDYTRNQKEELRSIINP